MNDWTFYCLFQEAVDELYHFRDHFFECNGVEKAAMKQEEIKTKLQEALTILDYVKGTIYIYILSNH